MNKYACFCAEGANRTEVHDIFAGKNIMASIKVKFRPSTVAGNEGTIYYQIIHERKVRQLLTDYKVFRWEWDESRSMVTATRNSVRKPLVLSIRELIHWDVQRLMRIDRRLEAGGVAYTADNVIEGFNRYTREYSLFNFMNSVIARLRQNGRIRTCESYRSALSSFRKFRKDEDIMLDSLGAELMEEYEGWLRQRGVSPNTISFYARILRAVYNRAVEDDIIVNRNPFRKVYTGIDRTVKRALPLTAVRTIRMLDLSRSPALDFARDMFMMSFYLRGMSFIDMAFLKKSDLRNGSVTYRRHKTGQLLVIAWTDEMQLILDKYPENGSDYLLPIIRKRGTVELYAYRNAGYNINRSLKKVAERAGIDAHLTLYVARHSWASAAKAKGIPLSVISEGLGHDSEATTQIYLASLDTSLVDNANSLILESLK